MKKCVFLCLMACMGATALQAQITLPTKKTTTGTSTPEKQVEKKQPQTQQKAEPATTPQDNPGAIPTLPTVKKEGTGEAVPEQAPTTGNAPVLTGGILKPLPVVVRKTAPRAKPIVKRPKPEDNEIYESAEHMPTYPGGASELMKFIAEKMQYPQEALADSAQGIVQVSFIVEKDGSTTEFEVLDEHHPALEVEAVRVLQQMPKWKPATQKGTKVRVEYVVPVKFALPNQ